MCCPSFRSSTGVTNEGLNEKTVEGPPHGPSEIYTRAQDITVYMRVEGYTESKEQEK